MHFEWSVVQFICMLLNASLTVQSGQDVALSLAQILLLQLNGFKVNCVIFGDMDKKQQHNLDIYYIAALFHSAFLYWARQ